MKKITEIDTMIESAILKSNTLRGAMLVGYWENIVNKAHSHSEVIGLKDKTLYIKVGNSSFLHFMNMKKDEYIEKINKFLNGDYVEKIVLKLGKINIENKFQLEQLKKEFEEKKIEKIIIPDVYKTESMTLEESIKYLAKMSKEREKYALSKGYVKCEKCKSIFLGIEKLCPKCRGVIEKTALNKN